MNKDFTDAGLSIVAGIIGLATLAVILSKNAQTSAVIQAASSGLSSILNVVVSPITGSSSTSTLGG